MDESTAVLESPELEAEEFETEGTDDTQESSEGEHQESTERQEQTQDEPSIIESDGKLKLSGKALETLNKLKAENPKQAREFRAALFDAATLRKEFPEGIREAVALKQELEEIGGMEAVSGLKGKVDEFEGLDADFQSGSPKFVDDIAAANPEAFAAHGSRMMSKYAELDNEGFTHDISNVFVADMMANNIGLTMERMKDFIVGEDGKTIKPGMEGLARQWSALQAYIDRVNGFASKAPTKKDLQPTRKAPEIEQREQALIVREFQTERNAVKEAITKSEYNKNLGNRKLAADKISTIQELYESALNRAVQATPKHKETVDRYVAAKDRAGYRKYMDGVIRKVAPQAMSAAFRRAGVGDKPGPKKVEAKPSNSKPATTATNTTGFTRVGVAPGKNTVDWTATNRIAGKKPGDGRFVLRDGSKILYQR